MLKMSLSNNHLGQDLEEWLVPQHPSFFFKDSWASNPNINMSNQLAM